ncbi:DUF6455 family protein [Celeribacter litoreus]|uniref:DUF6455 family protein n=1 Tax=Celeribacter litoreus TaxID=2876714 RepID=UPI001CCE2C94|nr:DUF6455 family protein [Celeribacter litoreus]MCA0042811.1 DUF6455 family protein [Celeribacter litoreus]
MTTDTELRPGTACLMHGMAERLGADVTRAASSGALSEKEVAAMEARCGNCTQHDACILWLLEHQGAQDFAPDYCLNTQELGYLRAVQNQQIEAKA